jgi:hypothetical protein
MKKQFLFASLSLLGAASLAARTVHAEASPPDTTEVRARIRQLSLSPLGETNGALLEDGSYVKWPADLLRTISPRLAVGDEVHARGIVTADGPNRVLDHVRLERSNQALFDDSVPRLATPPSTTAEPARTSQNITAELLAVGARPTGQIDHLLLAGDVSVDLPAESTIEASRLKLGEKLTVSGFGTAFSSARFVRAQDVRDEGKQSLLQASKTQTGKWELKEGKVTRLLLNLHHDLDGLLLEDGSVVKFPPIALEAARMIKPGAVIRVSGTVRDNTLHTDALTILAPNSQPQELRNVRPSPTTASATTLAYLKDTAAIRTIIVAPHGEADSLILDDDTLVKLGPAVRDALSLRLEVGQRVTVTGRGAHFEEGTVIEADSIRQAN